MLAPKSTTQFYHILVFLFELFTIFWCNSSLIMVQLRTSFSSQKISSSFWCNIGQNFLECTFQQDIARPYTAHVSAACLSACRTLPWSARSMDLSPIEHIWSIMGRALQPARDVDDLTPQLDRIWHDISQMDIRNICKSMPSRITACIRARDRLTHY